MDRKEPNVSCMASPCLYYSDTNTSKTKQKRGLYIYIHVLKERCVFVTTMNKHRIVKVAQKAGKFGVIYIKFY